MGKKLLNESCKFRCTGNYSILIHVQDNSNTVGKDSKKKILTSRAGCMVKIPLPCQFRPSQSGFLPCQIMTGPWYNTESGIKIKGSPVLTEYSYTHCSFGGRIAPVYSACKTSVGSFVGIEDIALNDGAEIPSMTDWKEDCGELPESSVNPHKSSVNPYASYAMCEYENCDRRTECEYLKSQIFVENDSAKLSSNYRSERKPEWNTYYERHVKKNCESTEGNWRIAAHHMISGNQVLMMQDSSGILIYGVIVKLANYFGYDINNAFNCIMLPTNESNFGEREAISRAAGAYEVMWLMGRQWHVGGHQYSLSKDTMQNLIAYYKKNPGQYPMPGNPDFFLNYRMAMKEEMDRLLIKYSRPQCWEINKEIKRAKFIADLNAVSGKVERYLLRFERNPRESFPFFVSKAAVEYAYDLPAAKKLVAVYGDCKGQVHAKRVRMERYMKNKLRIVPIEKGDMIVGEGQEQKTEFIRFCGNTMHFLIQEGHDGHLPFQISEENGSYMRTVCFGEENIMAYLGRHANEMMAFLQQGEGAYQPINKVVAKRLKEVI